MSIFTEFDAQYDESSLAEQVKAEDGKEQTYDEVPSGSYEVKCENIVCKKPKKQTDLW